MTPVSKRKPAFDRDRVDMPFLVQFKVEDDTATDDADQWDSVTNGQVYANIRVANGKEVFEASQAQQVISHVITIWNPPAATFVPKPSHQIWATINTGAVADAKATRKFRIRSIREPDYASNMLSIDVEEFGRDTGV